MRRKSSALFGLIVGVAVWAVTAQAGSVVLPGDVSVTLSAEPTIRLEPYQTIHFTLTVANRGLESIPYLVVDSGELHEEFTVYDGTNDCGLITSVADGPTDFWYNRTWYLASEAFGNPPLAAGESRTCHFTESLTSSASALTAYSFGVPEAWSDPDPSNDVSTVYLHRAAIATAVPALAPTMAWLLAGLLAAVAYIGRKQA